MTKQNFTIGEKVTVKDNFSDGYGEYIGVITDIEEGNETTFYWVMSSAIGKHLRIPANGLTSTKPTLK